MRHSARSRARARRRATSERDHEEDIGSHNAHDAGTGRANGHADTNLAAALQDGVVEHRIESDAGEQQCDGREESREHGDEALADRLVPEQIELRGDVRDTQAVMALRDELAKGVSEDNRVLGLGVNGEGGPVDGLGTDLSSISAKGT